jgi:hypothetical protein
VVIAHTKRLTTTCRRDKLDDERAILVMTRVLLRADALTRLAACEQKLSLAIMGTP